MESLFDICDVSFQYGKIQALNHVNLKLPRNSFLIVFGADDSGKTTLMNLMMGFAYGFTGKIEILGCDIRTFYDNLQEKVKLVPDDIIWEKIKAKDYFGFYRSSYRGYHLDLQHKLCDKYSIDDKVSLLDMTYRDNKMVQIIASVCTWPELLILDEPLNFLDLQTYRNVIQDLDNCNREGMGIVLATEKYSHRICYGSSFAYLKEGNIIQSGIIPSPDYRSKVISIAGGDSIEFEKRNCHKISEKNGYISYVYKGVMNQLPSLLNLTHCKDCVVEEMTLEEELDSDYSRWE